MCTHTKHVETDQGYEDFDGEWQQDIQIVAISTTVDIDLHRYKCTQCEKVMYYSGAARNYFEKGVKSNVMGLNT